MPTSSASEEGQEFERPWPPMDEGGPTGPPEELAAPPLEEVPRRARRRRKRRRLSWLGWLMVLTLIWPLLYGLLLYLYVTGWRPLRALGRFLLAVFGLHTALLLLAWGGVWLWQEWQRRARHRRFEAARTLEQLLALSPSEFEEWTGVLFERHGYRVHNTPDTADHGIDLMVTSPRGERAVVQCKRYRGTVGEPVVRDLYGTVLHVGADLGFLVTTGRISRAARIWAQGKPLELIDGQRLVRLAE